MNTEPHTAETNLEGISRAGLSNTTWLMILCLVGFAVYANTLWNGFVYDDHSQVLHNPYLRSFRYLPEIFTSNVWSFIGAQGESNYFRPIMTLGYFFCYQIYGELAYGFHLFNILVHLGVLLALFFVTLRLFGRRDLALGACFLFALHPVHTESVAWIAAVTELELALFYLLTFYFFLRLGDSDAKKRDRFLLGMVGCYTLALFSKEQALMLPLLAVAYEHFFRSDRGLTSWSEKGRRYGFLWLTGAAYVVIRVNFLGTFAPQVQMKTMTFGEVILSAIALVGQYITLLFFPFKLLAFYVFEKSTSFTNPEVLLGLFWLVAVGAGFLYFWRRSRLQAFAIVWFFVTLAPVLNAKLLAANVFTERYLYLPSVGFCWLAGLGMVNLLDWGRRRGPAWRWTVGGSMALVLLFYTVRTVTRNRDWNNDVLLYTKTLARSPDSPHIHNNLGTVYWQKGEVELAEREFLAAARLVPNHAIFLNNLGLIYQHQKKYEEALGQFRASVKKKPYFADAHLNMAETLVELERYEEAELQFRATVALSPLKVRARDQLGKLYMEQERWEEAEEQFRRSIEGERSEKPFDGLGEIYLQRGGTAAAEKFFSQALVYFPEDPRAHAGLGQIRLAQNRPQEAQKHFEQTLLSDPTNLIAQRELEKLRKRNLNSGR